jgi:nucleoside-diphosphate-sugar epimerase
MSIAITGAAGQLGRLVIDDLLSAGIPGTDLIAIAKPRPEIGHLDETDRCGHRMRQGVLAQFSELVNGRRS